MLQAPLHTALCMQPFAKFSRNRVRVKSPSRLTAEPGRYAVCGMRFSSQRTKRVKAIVMTR